MRETLQHYCPAIPLYFPKRPAIIIGSILNPLAGKLSEDTRKNGKGPKTVASHDWRSFYLSQYEWLKGSHMTKVVWLPNETDYLCACLVTYKQSRSVTTKQTKRKVNSCHTLRKISCKNPNNV